MFSVNFNANPGLVRCAFQLLLSLIVDNTAAVSHYYTASHFLTILQDFSRENMSTSHSYVFCFNSSFS